MIVPSVSQGYRDKTMIFSRNGHGYKERTLRVLGVILGYIDKSMIMISFSQTYRYETMRV